MNKIIIRLLFGFSVIFLISCDSSTSLKTNYHSKKDITDSIVDYSSVRSSTDTTSFLSDCKLLMNREYVGALQIANTTNDSANYLCFAACYDCPESYEIIFIYTGGIEIRKTVGYDSLSKRFEDGCNNNFSAFDCFAFVLPMRDPEKQEDIHAMNIYFPVIVKVYKRVKIDSWRYIKTVKANNFKEYVTLQFKTIYSE